jgi:hypothetical protein
MSPTTSEQGNTNMMSPLAPGPKGGGTPRGSRERRGAPGPGEEAGLSGSAGAAAGVSTGASGMSTRSLEAQPPEEEAIAGLEKGMVGGEEGVVKKRKGGSAVV